MQDRRPGKAQRAVAAWHRARVARTSQIGGKEPFIASDDVHGIKAPRKDFSRRDAFDPRNRLWQIGWRKASLSPSTRKAI
jgi:hypothetical protein